VWDTTSTRTVFPHYTTKGSSSIDRIYVTQNLRRKQQGAEAVAAAFTDHMAILLRLLIDIPCVIPTSNIDYRRPGRCGEDTSNIIRAKYCDGADM
jgi:hypothetical protein